jgi:signal transduction histidine kinase
MDNHESIIKPKISILNFLLLTFIISFTSIALLFFIIYAFVLYKDWLLLLPSIFIIVILCLIIFSLFVYPLQVVAQENKLLCSFIVSDRQISLEQIIWIKKRFVTMTFKADEALLWIFIKSKEYKFPYNYCIFQICGRGTGFRGDEYLTSLDPYIKMLEQGQ